MSNINIEAIEEQDVPKYIKKKPSNKSKSFNKTSHKHDYSGRCLTRHSYKNPATGVVSSLYYVTTYCSICGKIQTNIRPTVETDAAIRMMTEDEILEVYKKLEIIDIEDSFAQYVPIVKPL